MDLIGPLVVLLVAALAAAPIAAVAVLDGGWRIALGREEVG